MYICTYLFDFNGAPFLKYPHHRRSLPPKAARENADGLFDV